ncbi:MAG: hypothetical protein WBY88_13765 [Desulfosarcina sp.]
MKGKSQDPTIDHVDLVPLPDGSVPVDAQRGSRDEGRDALDADQLEAFESIMAQIEGTGSPRSLSDPDAMPDSHLEPSTAEDISDDIDDLLKEIASHDQESQATDASDRETPANEPDDDIIEFSLAEETMRTGASIAFDPEPKRARRTRKTFAALVAALTLLFGIGCLYWMQDRSTTTTGFAAIRDTDDPDDMNDVEAASGSTGPSPAELETTGQSRLEKTMEQLDRLRGELFQKQAEIEELDAYYQDGIETEIESVVETIRERKQTGLTFDAATADPHIRLGLDAIQRRDATIKKLKTPLNWLIGSREDLLFFSRKAGLLCLMADKTSGIDIEAFIARADDVMRAHRIALAQLTIGSDAGPAISLETIWQDILKRLTMPPSNTEKPPIEVKSDNATIWKDICGGDYSRKQTLTELSPEAARCLAKWDGRDLFLNGLTSLSAESARYLAKWEGEWLGLNGLADLSHEAAAHLSKWKGRGLSLNGLTRLPPRVATILSEWQGEQIELVNLRQMAPWDNPKTRLFLSESLSRGRVGKENRP